MEKKLLKKLGNYFTKGLKIGTLTTAVLMGAGCDTVQDNGPKYDYRVNYDEDLEQGIFLRHRFAGKDEKITHIDDTTEARIAWANQRYADAVSYMRKKVADFQDQVNNVEPAGNFLQPICAEVFTDDHGRPTDWLDYPNMDDILRGSNLRYSRFLGAVVAKVVNAYIDDYGTRDDYDTFKDCYGLLATRAYNDSLGYLKDSPTLKLNQQKAEFEADLQRLGIENNDNEIEASLNNLLRTVSEKTDVSLATLQDVVNLLLLNASMRGARDLGAEAYVQISSASNLQRPKLTNLDYDMLVVNLNSLWPSYSYIYKDQELVKQTASEKNI